MVTSVDERTGQQRDDQIDSRSAALGDAAGELQTRDAVRPDVPLLSVLKTRRWHLFAAGACALAAAIIAAL